MAYRSKKRDKTTEIYFNEYDPTVSIITHNTNLKNRLSDYASSYPEYCKQKNDDEDGCVEYEIKKNRLSFRLLPPCASERKEKARNLMQKINEGGDSM